MSSASGGSSGASGSTVIAVTVGNNGSAYGFLLATFGSVSAGALYGQTINNLYGVTGNTLLIVAGVVPQSFFRDVTFKYGVSGSTARNLTSASATYSNPGGNTQWQWNAQATFTVTDDTLQRFVIFYR